MNDENFQQQTKQIGTDTFKVAPFMAIEALKIKTYLMKLFAPALGKMLGGVNLDNKIDSDLLDSQLDGNAIGDALTHLFNELDSETLISLIKRLFRNVIVETKKDDKKISLSFAEWNDTTFDIVFRNNLLSVYKVIFFVLEVNYNDFFDLMRGFGSRFQTRFLKMVKESETKEQKE